MGCELIAILLFRAIWAQPLPSAIHDQCWEAAAWWFAMHRDSCLMVEMATPIGPLPFVLTVIHEWRPENDPEAAGRVEGKSRPHFPAALRVGDREIPFLFEVRGGDGTGFATVQLTDPAGSVVLTGYGSGSCTTPSVLPRHFLRHGTWKSLRLSVVQISFADERFAGTGGPEPVAKFAGQWRALAGDSAEVAILLIQEGRPDIVQVTGTDGETLACDSRIEGDFFRASHFDGNRAILLRGRLQDDGTLAGEWWDSARGLISWTGTREE